MTVVGDETLARQLQEELTANRRDMIDRLGDEALAWLALVPAWTERLAVACRFPEPRLSLATFLVKAEAAGWCVRKPSASPSHEPAFGEQLLVDLARSLPAHVIADEVLPRVLRIGDERFKGPLLARLTPSLPRELLQRVRHATKAMDDAGRAEVLTALVACLPAEERDSVVEEAVVAASAGEPEARARWLVKLAPFRDAAFAAGVVFEAVRDVEEPVERAELLSQLVPLLPVQLVTEALAAERFDKAPECRAELLAAAAPRVGAGLAGALVDELADLIALDEPWIRPKVLDLLTTARARAGDMEGALALADRIEDDRVRVHALCELIQPLSSAGADDLLADVVSRCERTAFRASGAVDVVIASRIVDRLAKADRFDMADSVARRMLEATHGQPPSPAAAVALLRAARALTRPGIAGADSSAARTTDAALRTARSLGEPVDRAGLLASISELLEPVEREAVVREALDDARSIHDDERRARALARLLPAADSDAGGAILDELLTLAAGGEADASFWMPQSVRPEVLGHLRARRDFIWLQQRVAEMGTRIRAAARSSPALVPPVTARWAELAGAAGSGGVVAAATALDERVRRVLQSGDTGAALRWLDTATLLRPVLRGEFETTTLANERRVELVHRRWLDRRHLRQFLPRRDQEEAFEMLMGPESPKFWALHYLGMGGVGKTMLIRHIAADLAPRWGAVTSRVDFDHLNPDFPLRRPGQLLLELAQELEMHAVTPEQVQLCRRALAELTALDATDAQAGSNPWTQSQRERAGARAVNAFCGFLESLRVPVVLLLDTTEELEKFQPLGARLPQLEATFSIIEALHDALPDLRVVFAGRRMIAQAGAGWTIDPENRSESRALLPESKPYLLLHEIRGFDEAEADEYLSRVKALTLPEDLRSAILAQSRDTGTAATIAWEDRAAPRERPRYNPFDIALYADLARESADLDAETIALSRSDVYVEARILQRLRHPALERLLPALVLLRRFDRDMLRPAFDGTDEELRDLYHELGNVEWIDAQLDAALETTFLEIDRSLLPRLEAYFQDPTHQAALANAARRLKPALSELVAERPLERLAFDHIDANLRLLEPHEAAALCERLMWRVVDEQAWGWARRVFERILGEAGALADPSHPAGAIARAIEASAMVHVEPDYDPSPLWAEVLRTAPAHPEPATARWLEQRAALGLIARAGSGEAEDAAAVVERTIETAVDLARREGPAGGVRSEVLAGGLLAAVERILDQAEATASRESIPTPEAIVAIAGMAGLGETGAAAYAFMLAARAHLLLGERDEALASFSVALDRASQVAALPPGVLADWLPPPTLLDRVRLEAIRAGAPLDDDAEKWTVRERLAETDAERLASMITLRRLDRSPIPAAGLEALELLDPQWMDRPIRCEAHRSTPPLFIALARGWLVLGDAERAAGVLDRRRAEAQANRDAATVRLADLAKLDVVRRMRAPDLARALLSRYAQSDDDDDRDRAALVSALVGGPAARPADGEPRGSVSHAWWRSQIAWTPAQRSALLASLRRSDSISPSYNEVGVGARLNGLNGDADFEEVSQALDLAEACLLATPVDRWTYGPEPFSVSAWLAAHPVRVEDAVRVALRQWALLGSTTETSDIDFPLDIVQLIGDRRMAELAFEEGEVLALRLGLHAATLLRFAVEAFRRSGDDVGALQAKVCALTALGRSGADVATLQNVATAAGTDLHAMYTACRTIEPRLSGWDAITSIVAARRHVAVSLRPPHWEGWLWRLVAARVLLSGEAGERAMLASAIRGSFGDHTPVELEIQPSEERAEGAEEAAKEGKRRPWGVLLVLAIIGAILFGLDRLAAWGLASALGLHTGILQRLLIYAGLLAPLVLWLFDELNVKALTWTAVIVASPIFTIRAATRIMDALELPRSAWVRIPAYLILGVIAVIALWRLVVLQRGVGRALASRSRTSVVITRNPDATDGNDVRFALVVRRSRIRVGWPPFRQQDVLAAEETGPRPDFRPYRRAAAPGLAAIPTALGDRAERVGGSGLRVALAVEPALAWLPWEAVLTPTTPEGDLPVPVSWWRAEELLPQTGAIPIAEGRPTSVTAPPTWEPLVEKALIAAEEGQPDDPAHRSGRRSSNLLIIVGSPVETVSGRRIWVSAGEAFGTAEAEGDGTLLEPDALPLRDYSAVIVQGEPGPSATRTVPERERTAELRGCAAELMASGARCVVFVPALPVHLAELVLAELVRWLSATGSAPDVLGAAESVRALIRSAESTTKREAEGLDELALEVTVFARDLKTGDPHGHLGLDQRLGGIERRPVRRNARP